MKKQRLTLTCITLDDLPDEQTFDCFVFGVWAVHRPHPNADPNWWHVTHIPTSAIAFVTQRYTQALMAARRLAALDPPDVSVKTGYGGRLSLSKLPKGWQQHSLEVVSDLDVYVGCAGSLVRPYELLREHGKPTGEVI